MPRRGASLWEKSREEARKNVAKKRETEVNMKKIGENVALQVEDDILTITVDLSETFGPSASGKTIIIASSKGNVTIPGRNEIRMGLNVYKYAESEG